MRTADKPMKRKEYENDLRTLQIELCALQDWIREKGLRVVVVLQMLFTYAPPLQAVFGTAAVPLRIWPWLVLGGFLFFLMVEAEKLILRLGRPR